MILRYLLRYWSTVIPIHLKSQLHFHLTTQTNHCKDGVLVCWYFCLNLNEFTGGLGWLIWERDGNQKGRWFRTIGRSHTAAMFASRLHEQCDGTFVNVTCIRWQGKRCAWRMLRRFRYIVSIIFVRWRKRHNTRGLRIFACRRMHVTFTNVPSHC